MNVKLIYQIITTYWHFIKANPDIPTTEDGWDELTRAAGRERMKYDGLENRFVGSLLQAYLEYVHLSAKEEKCI